ncbi:MAG: GSCFA domain-containing protein [Fibrobacter sp.]|nr:GSCFA domain-containing protein [Fibrobacter sp.]
MDFSTKVTLSESNFKIDYKSNLVFIGSCFADNISKRFTERKFHTLVNPLGVLYNPLSIENFFKKIAGGNGDSTETWCRWDYQGNFSEAELQEVVAETRDFLKKTDVVFITLGTAFVYFLKESGKAVANCHKEPADFFERRLISVEEAAEALKRTCKWIFRFAQDDVKIVFTVSPIRHLNDGAHGNNLSKSTLHLAVDKVCQEFANDASSVNKVSSANIGCADVTYFPSYEIVMDELRDYRFYAEDMTHLSKVAEDYIFEKMCNAYCSETTIANMKRVEKFMKTANHRVINPDSAETAALAQQILEKATLLEKEINGLDLSQEKER